MTQRQIVVSWGGGNNSTAMLVGMHERGIRPDHILFADVGHEWPYTYEFKDRFFRPWLRSVSFPDLTVVSRRSTMPGVRIHETLGEECLRLRTIPAVAFGWKTCSQKHKIEPQDDWVKRQAWAAELWESGQRIVKAIGYHADEPHRAGRTKVDETRYEPWFPLVEWEWGSEECAAAMCRAGLPRAGKSACTFCPHNTLAQWKKLHDEYPDEFRRILFMEENATQRITQPDIIGIMRRQPIGKKWLRDWVADGCPIGNSDDDMDQVPCECVDG